MKYKLCPAPFFNHFIECNPPSIAKLKSLHGVLRDQLAPYKWCPLCVVCNPPTPPPPPPQYDNFKILHPQTHTHTHTQALCYFKSYKFDNYDKTTNKVSPYCYIPQANLITRLLMVTENLVLSQDPSESECSALT